MNEQMNKRTFGGGTKTV